jgi:hypothetical protein
MFGVDAATTLHGFGVDAYDDVWLFGSNAVSVWNNAL